MEYKELQEKYGRIASHPDEKSRRLRCADEALATGRGGITVVSEATGVSRTAITEGIKEITGGKEIPENGSVRRKGGGRKKKTERYENIRNDIGNPTGSVTRGSPGSHPRRICKSTGNPAKKLNRKGYEICHSRVAGILKKEMNHSLQADRKTAEGGKKIILTEMPGSVT